MGSESLVSFELPLFVPLTSPAPQLQFTFGFATEEAEASQTFFDSFSFTVQNSDRSSTALLFTSDRTGTQWTPPNPGGFALSSSNVQYQTKSFPSALLPRLPFTQAFEVSFLLPMAFLGQTNSIFLDLFNNQNTNRSLAFVSNIHLAVPIGLQSSASPEGPFADEDRVTIDSVNQVISIPQFSPGRFFRVFADIPARITSFRIESDDLLFDYRFEPQLLRLQSAASQTGLYSDETNAVFDLDATTVAVPSSAETRFYRVQSDGEVEITREETAGNQLVLTFQFKPKIFGLQSSAQAQGPYSNEALFRRASGTTSLRLSKVGQTRYFRTRSVLPYRVSRIEAQSGQWLIHYE